MLNYRNSFNLAGLKQSPQKSPAFGTMKITADEKINVVSLTKDLYEYMLMQGKLNHIMFANAGKNNDCFVSLHDFDNKTPDLDAESKMAKTLNNAIKDTPLKDKITIEENVTEKTSKLSRFIKLFKK